MLMGKREMDMLPGDMTARQNETEGIPTHELL